MDNWVYLHALRGGDRNRARKYTVSLEEGGTFQERNLKMGFRLAKLINRTPVEDYEQFVNETLEYRRLFALNLKRLHEKTRQTVMGYPRNYQTQQFIQTAAENAVATFDYSNAHTLNISQTSSGYGTQEQ